MGGPRWHLPKWLRRSVVAQVGFTNVEMRDGRTQVALPAVEGRAGWTQVALPAGEMGDGTGAGEVARLGNGGWEDGGGFIFETRWSNRRRNDPAESDMKMKSPVHPAIPKLLFAFDPPAELQPSPTGSSAMLEWARANVAALDVVSLGPAGHHAPEDLPNEIGKAIADWLGEHAL